MGVLAPLFLLAGAAIAVPLYLHLFQRQEARRVSFPALRYLERTEREHARRIRLRQFLLLFLRTATVLVLVGAGARLFLRGEGSDHPPTALAIVLDNSMSSGLVVGEDRALDPLKERALLSLAAATEDDRIWVIRAGQPWLPAVPVGPAEARGLVEETGVSAGAGDLTAALRRAAELVSTSSLPAREIHLLSDLQASAFTATAAAPAGAVPVVVWLGGEAPLPPNRALTGVEVGGGLPPLEGQRSEIALSSAALDVEDTVGIPVRVVLGERVRGAGLLTPGATLVLPLPPAPPGWVVGYADADPDALRADDRRWFTFVARPAPRVSVAGDPGVFVNEAVAVLAAGGRLRPTSVREADAVVSASGEGLDGVGTGGAVLVVPPPDPTLLPSVNRRLQEAGIPWRFERREATGAASMAGDALPEPLSRVEVHQSYRLALAWDPTAAPRTLAIADGEPWAVEGRDPSGRRYLLVASALDATSTSLPVSSDMVRFVDWFTGVWAASGGDRTEREAGAPLSAPRGAETVRLPSGIEVPLDGTRMVRATGEAGIYAFLAGDTVLAYEAVNPSPAESDLTRLDPDLLPAAVGSEVVTVKEARAWEDALFRARRGPELWRPLVVAALLLLLLEAAVAAVGRHPGTRGASFSAGAVRGQP